jgi:hypothetical protein
MFDEKRVLSPTTVQREIGCVIKVAFFGTNPFSTSVVRIILWCEGISQPLAVVGRVAWDDLLSKLAPSLLRRHREPRLNRLGSQSTLSCKTLAHLCRKPVE